jgi:hypothetical protein
MKRLFASIVTERLKTRTTERRERKMLKLKKLKMPMPVTINDCVLLWQMGYRVEINDGRVTAVAKDKKKKRHKAAITPTSLYH